VVSESGSRKIIDHVFKKLLKAEQDAAGEKRESALTPANYDFALLDTTTEDGRRLFVLKVDPRQPRKYLFRGRIWVDADDYAVARLEAQPAQSPSFWIRDTEIRHQYSKMGDFWLPTQNTTVTKVRLGGTATLTIEYAQYQFQSATSQSANSANLAPGR